jgi:hypothetical protein
MSTQSQSVELTAEQTIWQLALDNGVSHRRSALDDLGDSITRLAGDDVSMDYTEWLLVELRRRNLIEGRAATLLHYRYLTERL